MSNLKIKRTISSSISCLAELARQTMRARETLLAEAGRSADGEFLRCAGQMLDCCIDPMDDDLLRTVARDASFHALKLEMLLMYRQGIITLEDDNERIG